MPEDKPENKREKVRMEYKVVVTDMVELDRECNRAARNEWELVAAFPETFNECCNQQTRKVVLIFKRPE
jgi:hypothetical protein